MLKKSIENWLKKHNFKSYKDKEVSFNCKVYFDAYYLEHYIEFPPFIRLTENNDNCIIMGQRHFTENKDVTEKILEEYLIEYYKLSSNS